MSNWLGRRYCSGDDMEQDDICRTDFGQGIVMGIVACCWWKGHD